MSTTSSPNNNINNCTIPLYNMFVNQVHGFYLLKGVHNSFLQSLYCTSVYAYKLFLRSVFCKEMHVEVQALYAHFWRNNSQLSSVVQLLNSAGKEVFCLFIVLLIVSSISDFFTVQYASIHSFMQIIAVCFSFHFFCFLLQS